MKRRPYNDGTDEQAVSVDGRWVFSDLAGSPTTVYQPFECPQCGTGLWTNGFCSTTCNDAYARDLAAGDRLAQGDDHDRDRE